MKIDVLNCVLRYAKDTMEEEVRELAKNQNKEPLVSDKGQVIDTNSHRYKTLFEMFNGNMDRIKKMY